jgi:hypothetical protein
LKEKQVAKDSILKCPACGYYFGGTVNYGAKIVELLSHRSRLTRKMLKKVSSKIQVEIPSDNSQMRYYYFLQGISKASDNVVRWAITRYNGDGQMYQTRGFAYLRSIILNEIKNKKKRLQHEYRTKGRSPTHNYKKEQIDE